MKIFAVYLELRLRIIGRLPLLLQHAFMLRTVTTSLLHWGTYSTVNFSNYWWAVKYLPHFLDLCNTFMLTYTKLQPCFRTVSAVQALLSCVTGCVVCTWSCTRNFLRSSHFLSEAYAWFGAAYFFYDIWSMYRVHSGHDVNNHGCRLAQFKSYLIKQPVIVLHHLFIGSFGFLVIVVSHCDIQLVWVLEWI
jgi:hypothetical protein